MPVGFVCFISPKSFESYLGRELRRFIVSRHYNSFFIF